MNLPIFTFPVAEKKV